MKFSWIAKTYAMIVHDWLWKLLALALACIIFFAIRQTGSYTHTLALVVEGEVAPDGAALRSFSPDVVHVTFTGTEADIRQLVAQTGPDRPKILVKVTPEIKLRPSQVRNIGRVRVVKFDPAVIYANLDEKMTAEFPVAEPVVRGAPEDGSVELALSQEMVSVRGSKQTITELLEKKTVLSTGVIDVSGRTENYTENVKINPPDNRGGWEITPSTIPVDIKFVRLDGERVFSNVWVRVVQSQREERRLRAEPAFINVKLLGKKKALALLKDEDVRLYAEEPEHFVAGTTVSNLVPRVALPVSSQVETAELLPEFISLIPIVRPTPQVTPQPSGE